MLVSFNTIRNKTANIQTSRKNFCGSPVLGAQTAGDIFTRGIAPFPSLKRISPEEQLKRLRDIYDELRKFEGSPKNFALKVYSRFKNLFGLDKVLGDLDLETLRPYPEMTSGTFDPFCVVTAINPNLLLTGNKADTINSLAHEFKHLDQFACMFANPQVGVQKFVLEQAKRLTYITRSASYITNLPIDKMGNYASLLKNNEKDLSKQMNFKKWEEVIKRLGLDNLDEADLRRGQEYFDKSNEIYSPPSLDLIDNECSQIAKNGSLPKLQRTFYYTNDQIGKMLSYFTDPMEKEAEQEGSRAMKDFLQHNGTVDKRMGLGKLSEYEKDAQIVQNFLKLINDKYGKKLNPNERLPERFIAFLYDFAGEVISGMFGRSPSLEAATKDLAIFGERDDIAILSLFMKYLDEDKIRLNTPEQLQRFKEMFS